MFKNQGEYDISNVKKKTILESLIMSGFCTACVPGSWGNSNPRLFPPLNKTP